MARAVQARRVLPSGARRRTTWGAIFSTGFQALAANSLVTAGSFNAAGLANVAPGTLIRVRGLLVVRSDQNAAIEDGFGAMGVAVVTERARNAGGTALPDPVSQAAADYWQSYQPFIASHSIVVGTGVAQETYTIDSKAQRRFGDLDAIVVQVTNADAASGISFMIALRFLFLLH